jgi:hypothetical protein
VARDTQTVGDFLNGMPSQRHPLESRVADLIPRNKKRRSFNE